MIMRWITASFSFLLAAAFGLYGISYLLIVIKSWGSRPDFAQVVLFGSYLPAGGW
jgi:hypothetical protein